MRFGAGIWLFGQFVDRYATDAYGPPVSTIEAIEAAGAVGDIEVLDINYPFTDGVTTDEVRDALAATDIAPWCITPHIYTRDFQAGAFSNPDPRVRAQALSLCEEAVGVAKALGAPTVKLWPGQDGFDLPLQVDYREVWRLGLEGVSAVAAMDDDIRVAIEYKTKEPRMHMSWSTAARTLVGITQMGREDIGIVMDLGHSLFAKEAPADALHLVNDHGRLFTVEVNDNWREWDDDQPVGSIHLIETLEFFLALRQIEWDQPILLDQFPFREDPVEAARSSINTMKAIDAAIDRIDMAQLADIQARQDPLAAHRLVTELLLGQAPVA
ncbi:TIM barrel protein [Solirubrobacter taibaiensis]|nr:TIM barrel protein [Solirubrobacter taibaiensis]